MQIFTVLMSRQLSFGIGDNIAGYPIGSCTSTDDAESVINEYIQESGAIAFGKVSVSHLSGREITVMLYKIAGAEDVWFNRSFLIVPNKLK